MQSTAHSTGTKELLTQLKTSAQTGLLSEQLPELQAKHGPNKLKDQAPRSLWLKFSDQFRNIMIWILLAACLISVLAGEHVDAIAILLIVFLNAILGFVQELKAEKSLQALKSMEKHLCTVIRNQKEQRIASTALLPGDLVVLSSGDQIPADCRLIESYHLKISEAALTGESVPVEKQAGPGLPEQTPLGDRHNMVFMGTQANSGQAKALVTATGMQTELGKIAHLLNTHQAPTTPLQERIEKLGQKLIFASIALVALTFALYLWRQHPLKEVFLTAISLAVAAIPEGLPAVVTISLAIGLQRMVRRNALVRRLASVETLGSVTVICTDKTGTLTYNEMTANHVWVDSMQLEVEGRGYEPKGDFLRANRKLSPRELQSPALSLLLKTCQLCNHASISEKNSQFQVNGDPTEGALLVLQQKSGMEFTAPRRVYENPFSSERKRMSVVVEENHHHQLLLKGAAERVLELCTHIQAKETSEVLTTETRQKILSVCEQWAGKALRVLGLAYKPTSNPEEEDEGNLIFLGLVGMLDPPRVEVKEAMQVASGAGVHSIMITGDHPSTAFAIAQKLNLAKKQSQVMTGYELEHASDAELKERLQEISVFARVTAEHKLRIVKALQDKDEIVAMTGDGVNDAPAIKKADIGIAMGITGTDVTRGAADMVLTDDRYDSIVAAIEEGRSIFANIQRFVHYLLASNVSEILVMMIAVVIGIPAPLLPLQILWINLVTDSLPALALAMEPPRKDHMQNPPRLKKTPILSKPRVYKILLQGLLLSFAALIAYPLIGNDLAEKRAAVFTVLATAQVFFSLACRSQKDPHWKLGWLTNPYSLAAAVIGVLLQLSLFTTPALQQIFFKGQVQFHWYEWALIFCLAIGPMAIIEASKKRAA